MASDEFRLFFLFFFNTSRGCDLDATSTPPALGMSAREARGVTIAAERTGFAAAALDATPRRRALGATAARADMAKDMAKGRWTACFLFFWFFGLLLRVVENVGGGEEEWARVSESSESRVLVYMCVRARARACAWPMRASKRVQLSHVSGHVRALASGTIVGFFFCLGEKDYHRDGATASGTKKRRKTKENG